MEVQFQLMACVSRSSTCCRDKGYHSAFGLMIYVRCALRLRRTRTQCGVNLVQLGAFESMALMASVRIL
jgi:hypothetical protein